MSNRVVYSLTLDDGKPPFMIAADFVDVLDGPARCVRFVHQQSENEAVVHAIYFGVRSVEFVEFADKPKLEKPKTKAPKKSAKK